MTLQSSYNHVFLSFFWGILFLNWNFINIFISFPKCVAQLVCCFFFCSVLLYIDLNFNEFISTNVRLIINHLWDGFALANDFCNTVYCNQLNEWLKKYFVLFCLIFVVNHAAVEQKRSRRRRWRNYEQSNLINTGAFSKVQKEIKCMDAKLRATGRHKMLTIPYQCMPGSKKIQFALFKKKKWLSFQVCVFVSETNKSDHDDF